MRCTGQPDPAGLIEDRERIARYLNDEVVSVLFSVGMGLQGMLDGLVREEQRTRLQRYVDALDTLIIRIRTSVFEVLTPSDAADSPFKRRLLEVVDAMSGLRAFTTEVDFSGPLDDELTDGIGDAVMDVVRTALSNVVLHSRAASLRIAVSSSAGLITVDVTDDGVGSPGIAWGLGLKRLRESAEQYGGTFEIRTTAGGGTALHWTARPAARV